MEHQRASQQKAAMKRGEDTLISVTPIQYGDIRHIVEEKKMIGTGGFGRVFSGTWHYNPVAVKVPHLDAASFTPDALQEFKKEVSLMGAMSRSSNYIVRVLAYCIHPKCCLVMEQMQKTLFDLLHSTDLISWDNRLEIALNIARGLAQLHDSNIIHRDLKSTNILLDKHGNAKLADFGLAKMRQETESSRQQKPKAQSQFSTAGTLRWMAPELLKTAKPANKASDIYAFGIVLWEILTRRKPFADVTQKDRLGHLIQSGNRPQIPESDQQLYPVFVALINECLDPQPTQRPNAKKCVEVLESLRASQLKHEQKVVVDPNKGAQAHVEDSVLSVSSVDMSSQPATQNVPSPIGGPAHLPQTMQQLNIAGGGGRTGGQYVARKVQATATQRGGRHGNRNRSPGFGSRGSKVDGGGGRFVGQKSQQSFHKNQVVRGVVVNFENYAAFVDIGGINGFLHNSNIAWERIQHPSDRLRIGQEITVKVLEFDAVQNRVQLGLKQMQKKPSGPAVQRSPFPNQGGRGFAWKCVGTSKQKDKPPKLHINPAYSAVPAASLVGGGGYNPSAADTLGRRSPKPGAHGKRPSQKTQSSSPESGKTRGEKKAVSIKTFMEYVMKGEAQKVDDCLQADAKLALQVCHEITDHAGRKFDKIRPLHYAWWAMDYHTVKRLLKHMDPNTAKRQIQDWEKSPKYGQQFDAKPLLGAYKAFSDQHDSLRQSEKWDELETLFAKIGIQQKNAPAHFLIELTTSAYSFRTCPDFEQARSPHPSQGLHWVLTMKLNGGRIGETWAIIKGNDCHPTPSNGHSHYSDSAPDKHTKDEAAMRMLVAVRQRQLQLETLFSKSALSPHTPQPVSPSMQKLW